MAKVGGKVGGKVGVLLLNLGGPERIQDVGPFLYNLFSDPEIIRLPNPALQKPLAWLISSLRAGKSQEAYRSIGGGSPLRRITEQQARELQSVLRQRGIEATSYVAMRYWHPFTESAVADIKADAVDEVVVLPLYPHFSISTSGSSFRELQRLRQADPAFAALPIRCIRSYHDDPGYIGAMAELIAREIQACPDPASALVFFSAHGVPKSYVEEAGDPYQREIEDCSRLIIERLERDLGHANPHTLAYQSRVGPVEWLRPYTDEALQELGQQGVKDLVVVPISFVSEHIETLEEIDIEYREIATEAGITNFRRVPALDTTPSFIEGLAQLVQQALEGPEVNLDQAASLATKVKLYPQDRWAWGWNNSSEVWNGRLAMVGFSAFLLELISGRGPLHAIGLL
jgi:protoporphyrin/coproporphyrin ferrochelatase